MIFGIGTDIVHIPRIEACLSRHGERFARRILTRDELASMPETGSARFLAKRFAVKEATAKALGTGFRLGVRMCEIGLGHDELGRPMIHLVGTTRDRAKDSGITEAHVSLSDEREFCIAFVTLVMDAREPCAF